MGSLFSKIVSSVADEGWDPDPYRSNIQINLLFLSLKNMAQVSIDFQNDPLEVLSKAVGIYWWCNVFVIPFWWLHVGELLFPIIA